MSLRIIFLHEPFRAPAKRFLRRGRPPGSTFSRAERMRFVSAKDFCGGDALRGSSFLGAARKRWKKKRPRGTPLGYPPSSGSLAGGSPARKALRRSLLMTETPVQGASCGIAFGFGGLAAPLSSVDCVSGTRNFWKGARGPEGPARRFSRGFPSTPPTLA